MIKKVFCFLIFSCLFSWVVAQSTYPINNEQDILHYTFNITINDSSNSIAGEATIIFELKDQKRLMLDLIGLQEDGSGMVVTRVSSGTEDLDFTHNNNRLIVDIDQGANAKSTIKVYYQGLAKNGLIIGDNKFGEKVFFGDNYPDRARNWLPCVDHPADKATVRWQITAPRHYKVIASGELVSEKNLDESLLTTIWETQVPISTKVMVFGAANFVVAHSGDVNNVPVTTWVYKQNGKEGFLDFAIAPTVLAYYDSLIGAYPYKKLANVQSRTTYGGMENASNIFYFENSVNGKQERENLIAHEIVHQWFGNSATESDWPHAWLSEGFATYLTHVYVGSRLGIKKMQDRLVGDRERVISYWYKNPLPIVNLNLVTYPQIAGLGELLSTNTYQKGGWVLHMLKNEIGEDVFWQAISAYYNKYKNGIASTADFQQVVEGVTGVNLDGFFNQWLYNGGQPKLEGMWLMKNGKLIVNINQVQENPFDFPLEIGLVYGDDIVVKVLKIDAKSSRIEYSLAKPDKIIFDPEIKLLYEGEDILEEQKL